MSTDLYAFLLYMSSWTGGTDSNIQSVIDEHNLFVSLGDFNSDTAVDTELNTLVGMATYVRDETVAADAIQISADVAAVASIWSFGLGMVAFAGFQAEAILLRGVISIHSNDLMNKLKAADTDIATAIDPKVLQYIDAFKANNNIVKAQQVIGMTGQTCRSILLQFMAQIELAGAKLDVATFRQYANSARMVLNSEEIKAVYNALDKLNMGPKSDDDRKNCLESIKEFTSGDSLARTIVRFISVGIIANRMNVAINRLALWNELADLLEIEREANVLRMMDCWDKFFVGIGAIVSVIDAVLEIIDIVDVVKQSNAMVDDLNGKIRTSYKDFYNGIKEAAKHYNEAVTKKTG